MPANSADVFATKFWNVATSDMPSCDDMVITFNQGTWLVLDDIASIKISIIWWK